MFTAYTGYFDTSGHPDDQTVMTTAGFVSTVKKWSRFDREWNAILARHDVAYFRMSEFVNNSGAFAEGWKGETEKRRKFIDELAVCLKKNVNKSFRTTLIIPDYNKIAAEYDIDGFLGRPYAFCCGVCSYTIRQWAKRKGVERKLLYYFEDGDKDKGDFESQHQKAFKEKPLFLPWEKAVAFQAADFAGWKIRKNITSALAPDHTIQKGMRLLDSVKMLASIPKDAGVMNYEQLRKYCIAWKVPRRNLDVRLVTVSTI